MIRKYDHLHHADRIAFIGNIAPEDIRAKYRGKSVKNLFKYGEANPVKLIVK